MVSVLSKVVHCSQHFFSDGVGRLTDEYMLELSLENHQLLYILVTLVSESLFSTYSFLCCRKSEWQASPGIIQENHKSKRSSRTGPEGSTDWRLQSGFAAYNKRDDINMAALDVLKKWLKGIF